MTTIKRSYSSKTKEAERVQGGAAVILPDHKAWTIRYKAVLLHASGFRGRLAPNIDYYHC